jgi:NitT/TauT family transport system ATP-binding protein
MSVRPGRIKEIVPVEIPRPRTTKDLTSPKAHTYIDQLRALLVEEYAE